MDNLAPVVEQQDVPTKKHVDDAAALKVAKAGDTMTGRLTVQGISIGDHTQWGGWDAIENGIGALIFAAPPGGTDIVLHTLAAGGSLYLRPNGADTGSQVVISASGTTFAKPVTLPADPTADMQAASKKYVDGKIVNEVTVAAAQPTDGSELWLDLDAVPAADAELAALRKKVESLEARLAALETWGRA